MIRGDLIFGRLQSRWKNKKVLKLEFAISNLFCMRRIKVIHSYENKEFVKY